MLLTGQSCFFYMLHFSACRILFWTERKPNLAWLSHFHMLFCVFVHQRSYWSCVNAFCFVCVSVVREGLLIEQLSLLAECVKQPDGEHRGRWHWHIATRWACCKIHSTERGIHTRSGHLHPQRHVNRWSWSSNSDIQQELVDVVSLGMIIYYSN